MSAVPPEPLSYAVYATTAAFIVVAAVCSRPKTYVLEANDVKISSPLWFLFPAITLMIISTYFLIRGTMYSTAVYNAPVVNGTYPGLITDFATISGTNGVGAAWTWYMLMFWSSFMVVCLTTARYSAGRFMLLVTGPTKDNEEGIKKRMLPSKAHVFIVTCVAMAVVLLVSLLTSTGYVWPWTRYLGGGYPTLDLTYVKPETAPYLYLTILNVALQLLFLMLLTVRPVWFGIVPTDDSDYTKAVGYEYETRAVRDSDSNREHANRLAAHFDYIPSLFTERISIAIPTWLALGFQAIVFDTFLSFNNNVGSVYVYVFVMIVVPFIMASARTDKPDDLPQIGGYIMNLWFVCLLTFCLLFYFPFVWGVPISGNQRLFQLAYFTAPDPTQMQYTQAQIVTLRWLVSGLGLGSTVFGAAFYFGEQAAPAAWAALTGVQNVAARIAKKVT